MTPSILMKSARGAVDLVEQGGHLLLEIPQCLFVGRVVDGHGLALRGEGAPAQLDEGLAPQAAMPPGGNEELEELGEQVVIGFHPAFYDWLRSVRAKAVEGQGGKEAA